MELVNEQEYLAYIMEKSPYESLPKLDIPQDKTGV